MMQRIINTISSMQDITAYKIDETTTSSYELFYVLKELELSRATSSTIYYTTIYVDQNDQRGFTVIQLNPGMSDDEIKEELSLALQNAKVALNPYFPLVEKYEYENKPFTPQDLKEMSVQIVNGVFKADHYQNGWINSTEIFLKETIHHFVTSNKIDISYASYSYMVEIIPTWSSEKEEVELYKSFEGSSIDEDMITKEVEDILEMAKNRAIAKNLENKNIPVVLQKDEVKRVMNYFVNEMNYTQFFNHTNIYHVGDNIQDNIDGTPLSITLKANLPHSIYNAPIDSDGILLKDYKLIDEGKILQAWGSHRFGYYLNMQPTGLIQNIEVNTSDTSIDNFNEYLLICSMSGLQIDRFSNYIGGEVRLAYYYKDGTMTPVTNLSISGNMNDVKKHMILSKEVYNTTGYTGPYYLYTKDMKIS